jgi:hypothetical protein
LRVERLAPWLAGAITALPVALAHYPPMADLPYHELVAAMLRHWGDSSFAPPSVYRLNIGYSNQLFYFPIALLGYVCDIGLASRIVVALTLLLLPVSAAKLADYLGVTRWTTALVAPLGLGWMFFWGLLANLIGLEIFFAFLPALDRFVGKPTFRGFLGACGCIALLHLAHDLVALTAAGTLVLFTLVSWKDWRANALRLAPAALAVGASVVGRTLTQDAASSYHTSLPAFYYYPLAHKLVTLPGALFAGYEWWVRDLIFALSATPAVLFAFERWRHRSGETFARRNASGRGASTRAWAYANRFELLAAALMVGYFAAPTNMRSTTLIYHRFAAPAWVLFVVTAATRTGAEQHGGAPSALDPPWALPRLLAAVVPFVQLLPSWPAFFDSDRVYRELDDVIHHMSPNSSYIVLELGPTAKNLLYQPLTGGGHVVAELGGRAFFDYTTSPQAPVTQRVDQQWLEEFGRIDGHSYRFMPSHDFHRFRYAILHTTDERLAIVATAAMGPYAEFVYQNGEWAVLESKLPILPLDAPDEALPTPHPKTLHRLMTDLRNELLKELPAADEALQGPTAP